MEKSLVIIALDSAFQKASKSVPKSKKETVYICLDGVSPLNIPAFMKENGIPDKAWFGGKPNGYDSFDEVCLCFDAEVPTTQREQESYLRRVFGSYASRAMYDYLVNTGYTRVGCSSPEFKRFGSLYDMYINKDFDQLIEYYSLAFKKI